MRTKDLIRDLKTLRDLGHRQQVLADRLIDELTSEGREESPAEMETECVFRGISDMSDYLLSRGYKARKSKLYADRKAGLIRTETDGRTITLGAVQDYIRMTNMMPKNNR